MLLFFGCAATNNRPRAVNGSLDLSSWSFDQDGISYLDGDWEFYWGRLLKPGDLNLPDPPERTGYFAIPGYWNDFIVADKPLSGYGCATFRLRVKVRPGERQLALRIEDQSSAYQLWVNGVLIMSNGQVGPDRGTSRPYFRISRAAIPEGAEDLECVLLVSNFDLAHGGPCSKIAIGTEAAINKRHEALFALDLMLFAILGIMGIYHLVFYLLRRRERSFLYFGFFCLSWAAGIPFGATSGRFITLLIPDFPWFLLYRMADLTWIPIVPLGIMFFRELYPEEFSLRAVRFFQVMGILFFLFALFIPLTYFDLTTTPYSAITMAVVLYTILMLFRAARLGRSGAAVMLTGFLFFAATGVNDILYMYLLIDSVYLVSVGIAVMILAQSFALASRFARAFSSVETHPVP